MSRLALRPYQRDAVTAVRAAWAGGMRCPAVVLPTGTGKTVVFSEIADQLVREGAGRVLVLAHRDELINQGAAKLGAVSGQRVGVVKAGRNEVGAPIIMASVQTLRSRARRAAIRDVAAVIVDECHHATAPTYLDILGHFGCLDDVDPGRTDGKRAVAAGFTATMSRGDGGPLGLVWDDVVARETLPNMIRLGYLVEPRGIRVNVGNLDLDRVKRSGGDWQDGALGEALTESDAPAAIVRAWIEHARDRPTVLFGPTVAFAGVMVDAFRAAGITSDIVHGGQSDAERRAVWAAVERGEVMVTCNCMVATEGTDVPRWSCAIIARMTGHIGLYVQMVGRVLRLFPGKSDALVLDVAGATSRHKLASVIDLIGTEDTSADAVNDGFDLDADALDTPLRDWEESDEKPLQLWTGATEEIDLFHGSRLTWLRTDMGVWFLPVGSRYVAIMPALAGGDAYDVVSFESWNGGGQYFVEQAVPDLGYAMGFGENVVTEAEAAVAARDAEFRNKAMAVHERRRAVRAGLGPNVTRGQLIEYETRQHATGRLDPVVRWASVQRAAREYGAPSARV